MPQIQSNKTPQPRSTAAIKKAAKPMTKRTQIEALLRRKKGARLEELTKTTGWQPHSIRAALTGLRKTGADISRDRDTKGATVYRIVR